jgi:hypothetical protein
MATGYGTFSTKSGAGRTFSPTAFKQGLPGIYKNGQRVAGGGIDRPMKTGSRDRPGIFRGGRKEPSGGTIRVRRDGEPSAHRVGDTVQITSKTSGLAGRTGTITAIHASDGIHEVVPHDFPNQTLGTAGSNLKRVRRGGERTYNRDEQGRFA